MRQTLWTKNFTIITLGTVISAIGGVAMSFALGFVVGCIHVLCFDYVFNFADCCINVGAGLFVIHVLFCTREGKETLPREPESK